MHGLQPAVKDKPLSGRQRKFCEGIVRGWTATKSYMVAYSYEKSGQRSAEANACRLLRTDRVKAEIEEMRRRVDEKKGGAVLSAKEKREYLARVVRAKPSDAALDNPDCNLVMTKAGPVALFPDKLSAIKLDNDLAGDLRVSTLRLELVASAPDSPPPLEALDVDSEVSREGHEQRE